jgi:hypothetical protein
VVVIGDTPKDVAAAPGLGAACIGVGTGGFAPEKLVKLGAHRAFATLEGEDVFRAVLNAWRRRRPRTDGVTESAATRDTHDERHSAL